MFFMLSKILGAILSPLNAVFVVLAAGAVAGLFSRRAGRSLAVLGMVMFIAGGVFPTGPALLARLEAAHAPPDVTALPPVVDGILILGGSFMSGIAESRNVTALNETAERVITALSLGRAYPNALIVFSGGNGRLRGGDRTEAQDMEDFLAEAGIGDANVLYEDESRNTYENLKYSFEIVLPQQGETWLLVTSAYHMPRALAVARAQGWDNIQPYPVDYRTDGKIRWIPDEFDLLGNFRALDVALHEYIGTFAYQMTGKLSLPLK